MQLNRQLLGFLAAGVVSTLLNLGSRYVFERFSSYELALLGANTVGVLSAYCLNRWFVFAPSADPVWAELGRFVAVNLLGIALSWVTAVLLFRWAFPALGVTWHPDLLAHAIGILVPVLPNYFMHKRWTFNQTSRL
jgi:putative flippase GtrA